MSLKNKSTTDLQSELDKIAQNLAEHVARASDILTELRNRKVFHPFMRTSILRHHAAISNGTLSPTAVIALGGNLHLIEAIKPLPTAHQEAFANGDGVDIAEMKPDGEIVTITRPIVELSASALKRVFGPNGVRSISEQKALMGNRQDRTRIDGIIVDKDQPALIFGRKRVRPHELIGPLKALGYELKKTTKV